MSCHPGYTLQHTVLALFYLVLLAGLAASDTQLKLRAVCSIGSVAGIVSCALLAAACESPSVSAKLDALWHINWPTRLRLSVFIGHNLLLACLASWCVLPLDLSGLKAANLLAVCVPVLASVFLMWGWSIEESIEGPTSKCAALIWQLNGVGLLVNWLIIHSATRSRVMTMCAHLFCWIAVSAFLLRNSCTQSQFVLESSASDC